MRRTAALLLCVVVSTSLAACSSNSTTKTDVAARATPSNTVKPASTPNQQLLDQKLFNVVGESELSQNPDDAQAAIAAITAGANVNARNRLGDTPLLIAARNGRVNVLKVLLDKGANVNAQDDNRGQTALIVAVGNVAAGDGDNDVEAVRLLIVGGADVNMKDNNGLTALSGSEIPSGNNDPKYLKVRQMLKKAGAK
jgi:ankyrin repeat protein